MEMAQSVQKELKKIFEKMDPIIAGFAQRDGLTMMFEKTDSGLVYAPASLDITNELVRMYNDQNKAAGGTPGPTTTTGGSATGGTGSTGTPPSAVGTGLKNTAPDAPKK